MRATVPNVPALLGAVLLWAGSAAADQLAGGIAAPSTLPAPTSGILAIRGAHVHPIAGAELPSGTVIVQDGKIAAVGADVPIPEGAAVVEAAGRHLWPGFIDGNTSLGLVEISSVRGSVDVREIGEVNPDVQAELAVNPGSHLIGVARSGGVTTVLVLPDGELLAGTAALMNLQGWTWEQMLVRSRVGLHLKFPYMQTPAWWESTPASEEERKKARDERLKKLDRIFDDAEAYHKARSTASQAPGRRPVPPDVRLEALGPVLRGEVPLIVTAVELPTIRAALDWAEKRKLRIVLNKAADAWRLAEELARRKIPVLLPETLTLPQRPDEPYDTPFTQPRKLHEAGVEFCFTSGGEASLVQNLPHQAAAAVAHGLPRPVALEALTLAPARILGVAERLGSIEPGKEANLVLTDGDPLDLRTRVVAEWIGGQPVDLRDKHVQLYELWRSRPPR